MDNNIENKLDSISSGVNYKETFFRFFIHWPWFILSLIFFLIGSYIYLRYSENVYEAKTKIQILDKSQDSEMALPTAMTIFNRSMVNLENEIGVITSYNLNRKIVSELKF